MVFVSVLKQVVKARYPGWMLVSGSELVHPPEIWNFFLL